MSETRLTRSELHAIATPGGVVPVSTRMTAKLVREVVDLRAALLATHAILTDARLDPGVRVYAATGKTATALSDHQSAAAEPEDFVVP
jgi:hypothetical protein